MSKEITTYKGFDQDLKCRDFQYEVGKTYKHEGDVGACSSGFHGCENPFDVWSYYPPAESRFCEATQGGELSRHDGDSKVASAEITITAELTFPEFVQRGVDWILSNVKDSKKEPNTGNCSAATNTGYYSAATNTGNRSAATNTGYCSAATNTGYCSAATNTGDYSAATVEGSGSIAIASGIGSRAMASDGSAIVLCEYNDNGSLKKLHTGIAGRGRIKPDTFYTVKNGKIVEWMQGGGE